VQASRSYITDELCVRGGKKLPKRCGGVSYPTVFAVMMVLLGTTAGKDAA
jgi:hypothetical protein